MNALDDQREVAEAVSPWQDRDRWLAASAPDDDPDWPLRSHDERAAA